MDMIESLQNHGRDSIVHQMKPFQLPLSRGKGCSSASLDNRYLDDPWDFFCFLFNDPFLNGSILSTNAAVGACKVWGEE